MSKRFEGLYFKHQKGPNTFAVIVGASTDHSFIQTIAGEESHYFTYPRREYIRGKTIKVGDNEFSEKGMKLNINQNGVSIYGNIRYDNLTPLKYDIMGFFKYFPMQCRHKILSLHHNLRGELHINEKTIDFTDGIGYIEGDSGVSFPKSYAWFQCNSFAEKACVTVSVADIPFLGIIFRGCIASVYFNNTEHRLATYLGGGIVRCSDKEIILRQGRYRLEIQVSQSIGHSLAAPQNGFMTREIIERAVCDAHLRFLKDGKTLFDQHSRHASFEFVN